MADLPSDWASVKTREILALIGGTGNAYAIEYAIRETVRHCVVVVAGSLHAGKAPHEALTAILQLARTPSRHASAGDSWVEAQGPGAVVGHTETPL